MPLADTFKSIRFRFLKPHTGIWMPLWRFLVRPYWRPLAFIDSLNTVLPFLDGSRTKALSTVARMPKMSTLAIGAIINESVRQMRDDSCYLNIGVWKGFSLFAGMAGNSDKHCIGVDSFSEFGGSRDEFEQRFLTLRSDHYEFFQSDWKEYMKKHTEKIGVFFYDAEHDEKNQFDAMMLADPFIVPGGIIIVDDANWTGPSDAVKAFLSQKKHYVCIFGQKTACNCHPTFWNGLIVLQKCS